MFVYFARLEKSSLFYDVFRDIKLLITNMNYKECELENLCDEIMWSQRSSLRYS